MSRAATCYFALTHSLQGCYMPDMHFGGYAVTRRKDLIAAVREALEMMEAPQSAIRQINWTHLWSSAKRYGTSSVHFSIETGEHSCLSFHGLTEAEYDTMQAENDQ